LVLLGITFAIFSLGPVLRIWGKPFPMPGSPYAWLEAVFPPLRMSGMPVRMFLITVLCGAVISAVGFQQLFRESPRHRVLAVVLILILIPEYMGKRLPSSPVTVPEYISILAGLSGTGGVLDNVSSPPEALFFQTVHQ